MDSIIIGRAGEHGLGAPLLDSMYHLRREVFHDRLRWDVRVEHGREHDWFDLIGPHYLIARESPETALGCCRLLPTLGPNMLRDIFPFLLDGMPPPAAEDVWEVSRFAISQRCARDGFGFSEIPALMIADLLRFANAHGVYELVGVTSAPFERMMRHLGLKVLRLGKPKRIGEVMSLAFSMPVEDNLDLFGLRHAIEVSRAA
jgi:acyl homoserine lactone synthase